MRSTVSVRFLALAMSIGCLAPRVVRAEEKTTVGVDLTTLASGSYEELDGLALEKRLVLRLVQEGFAVVAASEQPDILLTIRRVPERVVVETRGPLGLRHTEIPIHGDPMPEVHLEVAQKAVDLVRGSTPAMAAPASLEVGATKLAAASPPEPRHVDTTIKEPRAGTPGSYIEPSVGLDVLWRGDSADPLVRIGLRTGIGHSFGLHLSAGLAPSSGRGIDVREWQLQAGSGYRRHLGGTVELEIAVLLGVLVQDYSLDDRTALDSDDSRIDVLATLPIQLDYWPRSRFGLALRIAPGVADEGRQHTRDAQVLWIRSAYRLEAGATAIWRW